jgi:hypothetical protein
VLWITYSRNAYSNPRDRRYGDCVYAIGDRIYSCSGNYLPMAVIT